MNLFKRPKYLLMILLASISLATFAPYFVSAQPASRGENLSNYIGQSAEDYEKTLKAKEAGEYKATDDGPSWIAIQLGHVVYWFTIRFPSIILLKEIELFRLIGTYNGFTTEPQVAKAWSTVRDLANMFFILILLLMSFGTILQIPGYGYRQLLSRLLLMAILINFSKSIVAILIDFSQIITLTFLAPVFNNIGGNLEAALGLSQIMQLPSNPSGTYTGTSFLAAMILGGIMMIITTVIIGVILAMFLMRVVAFWVMVILSPMAYLAKAFPKTTQYYSQWETELSKNLTLGPGLAFFIWLAFSIVGQGNINSSFSKEGIDNKLAVDGLGSLKEENENENLLTSVSKAATTANMLNFVVGIALLMAGLKFAAASGAAGASFAGKASGNLQKWGSRIGRGATVGAAVGAGALAWRGTSGEGGVKGGLSWTKSAAGRGMVKVGDNLNIGALQRGGLSMQATETARRQRKQAKFDKRFENMTAEQDQKYNESLRDGFGFLGKREAKARLARNDVDSRANLSVARVQNMVKELEAAGDTKTLERLRSRHMAAATPDSLRRQITERGLSSVSGMNSAGMTDAHVQVLMEQDPKALTTMLESKDKADRDVFMTALNSSITGGTLAGSFSDISTVLGRARLLQGKFDSDNVHTAFSAASVAEQEKYAKNLAASTKAEDLVKMDSTRSDLFKQVSRSADPSKANEMYSRAQTDEQRQIIVNSQVSVGNIQNIMNNTAIDKNLIDQDEILNHFDSKISALMTTSGLSRVDAQGRVAQRNLHFAHVAFQDPGTKAINYADLGAFAQSLRFDDLIKLDTPQLRALLAGGHLTPEQVTLLKDRQGIT